MRTFPIALVALAFGLAPNPALAQQQAAEPKVNMVIVYGEDKCPESTDDTIVVCPRLDESERYRIPPILRTSEAPSNVAWTERVRSMEVVGRTGTMSCSPVGAGGWTGCTGKLIKDAYAERATDPSVHAGELIAAERQKRLSTIDAEAAETQAAVEQQEEQIEARRKLEQQASGQAPQPEPSTTKPPATPPPPKGN